MVKIIKQELQLIDYFTKDVVVKIIEQRISRKN